MILTDAHTLALWQSLDRGEIVNAWRHYSQACDAAQITESPDCARTRWPRKPLYSPTSTDLLMARP